MPIHKKQNNFTAGEFSPRLYGRTDFAKYQNAVKEMTNFYAHPHGGAIRRSGTKFIAGVRDDSKEVRLVSFEFSSTQTYIIEFGNLYCRFYKDQGIITVDDTITATAIAGDTVTFTIGGGFSAADGDEVTFSSMTGTLGDLLNGNTYIVANTAGNDFGIEDRFGNNIDVTGLTENNDGTATVPYSVTTTYTEAELPNLSFTQSADTLYICHVDHAPATLTRSAHTNWTLADIVFTDAPASWGANDYPKYVTFFENRLVLASNVTDPQTIWFSKLDAYTVFTVGSATDIDPVTTTLVSNSVNVITWLAPAGGVLLAGTTGGEWTLEGDASTGITPSTLRQKRQTTHGSKAINPLSVESKTLFIQRQGQTVRDVQYQFESDSYVSPDLSILGEHLTRTYTIDGWAFAEEPNSIVWATRTDGTLLGMTIRTTQDVIGWHKHTTGASGQFESVAVVSGADRDEIWVSVKRTINSTTQRYIELFVAEFNPGTDTDASTGVFVDSSLSYSGSAVSTLSGLGHLEGESVDILADGKVHAAQTVSSGSITLDYTATEIHAGLSYNSNLDLLPFESDDQRGTSTGRVKRITRVTSKINESVGMKVGPDSSNLEYVPFNDAPTHGAATLLFSGDKELDFYDGHKTETEIYIRQDQPLPLNILSITAEMEVSER